MSTPQKTVQEKIDRLEGLKRLHSPASDDGLISKARIDPGLQVASGCGSGSPIGPQTNLFPQPRPPPSASDDELPPWFGKMKISLLEGVDEMFDKKIVPIQKDIQEIKDQAGKAEQMVLEAKTNVENLRKELSQSPPGVPRFDEDLRNRVRDIKEKSNTDQLPPPAPPALGGSELATNSLVEEVSRSPWQQLPGGLKSFFSGAHEPSFECLQSRGPG